MFLPIAKIPVDARTVPSILTVPPRPVSITTKLSEQNRKQPMGDPTLSGAFTLIEPPGAVVNTRVPRLRSTAEFTLIDPVVLLPILNDVGIPNGPDVAPVIRSSAASVIT